MLTVVNRTRGKKRLRRRRRHSEFYRWADRRHTAAISGPSKLRARSKMSAWVLESCGCRELAYFCSGGSLAAQSSRSRPAPRRSMARCVPACTRVRRHAMRESAPSAELLYASASRCRLIGPSSCPTVERIWLHVLALRSAARTSRPDGGIGTTSTVELRSQKTTPLGHKKCRYVYSWLRNGGLRRQRRFALRRAAGQVTPNLWMLPRARPLDLAASEA